MPNTGRPEAAPALRRLGSAAAFGAIGLTLSGVYAVSGYGLPCPWRMLTNTLCPFCGGTTLGARLLHLDIAGAWQSNQFVLLLLAGAGIACLIWLVEVLGGPRVRLRGRWANANLWWIALGVATASFWILRNLVPLS